MPPSKAQPPQKTYFLHRLAGLGDVLMALPACKALKRLSGKPVVFITSDGCRDLVQACPHVDRVVTTTEELRKISVEHVRDFQEGRFWNLQQTGFGTAGCHQVDAIWKFIGIQGGNDLKDIELRVPPPCQEKVDHLLDGRRNDGRRLVLLHPATGDPNRTWPREAWAGLARALKGRGLDVALVGSNLSDPYRGAERLDLEGTLDLIDQLDPLELVALCRRADLLVSTDGGPIQLAGATDIAIVGIYTVVKGAWRLPYRHGQAGWRALAVEPSCPEFPCFSQIERPEAQAAFHRATGIPFGDIPERFAKWCLVESPYACLQREITVEAVEAACLSLLEP